MKIIFALLMLLATSRFYPQSPDDRIHFKENKFSIKPFETTQENSAQSYSVLFMLLPQTSGFAPNINIIVQKYSGSLEDYKNLSDSQFKQGNMTVIQSKNSASKYIIFEYTGSQGGKNMHYYSRALKREDNIYLVTGTALIEQWDAVSVKIKDTVDSFKFE
jgi:hypothetical protein